VFANSEAILHYRRCLELVEQLPEGRERDDRQLDILAEMSAPLNAVRGYSSPELQSTLQRSADLAERLGYTQVLAANLVALFAACPWLRKRASPISSDRPISPSPGRP
jgi:hypothetical protein